ncbi:MAG: hypothetical protein ACRDHG_14530 [Anaerolineales bacterium]
MTPGEAIEFVSTHGVVLESAKGPIPNLAEAVAGEPIRGSYWGHPRGDEIFGLIRAIRASKEILVCRLVKGKVTYVHARLWPALVRLEERLDPDRLAAIREVHSPTGKHELQVTPFPDWVPAGVSEEAKRLTVAEAVSHFGEWFQRQLTASKRSQS